MTKHATAIEPRERPIIFTAESVRAILAGHKTQTRRVMKPQPPSDSDLDVGWYHPALVDRDGEEYPGDEIFGASCGDWGLRCPYGAPGDLLWCREAFGESLGYEGDADAIVYRADFYHRFCHDLGDAPNVEWIADEGGPYNDDCTISSGEWKSPLFLPRWASRLILRIVDIRVERLQSISEIDCEIEIGAKPYSLGNAAYQTFREGWQRINGKRPGCAWDANPFVWVIEFTVESKEPRL